MRYNGFQILLGITVVPREIEDNANAKFRRVKTRCNIGNIKMVNTLRLWVDEWKMTKTLKFSNKHLTTGPEEKSQFCFPRISMFPEVYTVYFKCGWNKGGLSMLATAGGLKPENFTKYYWKYFYLSSWTKLLSLKMKVIPCCSRHQPRSKSILSEVEVFELFIALFKSSLLIKKIRNNVTSFSKVTWDVIWMRKKLKSMRQGLTVILYKKWR